MQLDTSTKPVNLCTNDPITISIASKPQMPQKCGTLASWIAGAIVLHKDLPCLSDALFVSITLCIDQRNSLLISYGLELNTRTIFIPIGTLLRA